MELWLFHNFIRLDLFSAKILMTSSKSMHSASYIDFVVIPTLKFPRVGMTRDPYTYTYSRAAQMFFWEGQIRIFFIFRGPENRRMRQKWRHIFRGMRVCPHGNFLKFGSLKWHFVHFEGAFVQNLKVLNGRFFNSVSQYFGY